MSGKNWILLVAGSKGWENYKHQANVCLHYQILKQHPEPIPDQQIVVMMYDDIARNPKNPRNGTILSVVDHSDVYSGVPEDYTGKNLTPENFLAALRGDKSTHKKVIESGPNDNIYIYMSGLGQEGAFQFPEKTLSPEKLIGTLKNMHKERKFSKMVIYMDSSYSATMFQGLPKYINVFVLASCSKYTEITPTDYNKERDVFLSDKFSRTWLKYLDKADFTTEKFHELVKTRQSKYLKQNSDPAKPDDEHCPCVFGDKKITDCYLSEFLQQ